MEWILDFGAGAGGVAAAGVLLKIWFEKRLANSLDKELERFRIELIKDVDENRIRNELLKSERNRVHQSINEFLDRAAIAMKHFERSMLQNKDVDIKDAMSFMSAIKSAQSIIRREEVNLSPSIPIIFENLFGDDILKLEVTLEEQSDEDEEIYKDLIKSLIERMHENFSQKRARLIIALRETL